MRHKVRIGLALLTAVALAAVAEAQNPAAPAQKSAPPRQSAQKGTAPTASPEEVLATVNGDKITRGDVVEYISNYPIPSNLTEEQVYERAVDALVNTHLLTQYLDKQRVPVSEKQIDDEVATYDKQLRENNQTLAARMAETGTSMAELRDKIKKRLQWSNLAKLKGTDAELRNYAEQNKDVLNGTQVRASDILLMVDPDAPAAEKEKVKQKLLAIKKEIEGGKITFAEAANKYSEDPANVQSKAGGDLNFFPRKNHFIEPLAAAAFALKPGQISEPVETPYGFLLIQVTDRREGTPIDFAQKRELIFNAYAADLMERIIADLRKAAKIDVKPMPKDLFQPPPGAEAGAPPAANPNQPAPAPAPKPATGTPKSTAPR